MRSGSTGLVSRLPATLLAAPTLLLCSAPLVVLAARASGAGDLLLHLARTVLPGQLALSLLVSLGAVVCGAALALPGMLCALLDFPGRPVLARLLLLPLLVPAWSLAALYRETLGLFGTAAHVAVLGVSLAPLFQLLAGASLRGVPGRYHELAAVVGRDRPRRLACLLLPLALPGLAGAGLLAFLLAWGDVGTARLMGTPTLTVGLFDQWFGRQDPAAGAAVALVLVACGVVPALLLWRLVSRRPWQDDSRLPEVPGVRTRLRGRAAVVPWLLAAPLLAAGVVVPAAVTAAFAWTRLGHTGLAPVGGALLRSLLLAAVATMLAAALALPLVRQQATGGPRLPSAAAGLAAVLVFCLPPAVLGLAWLALLPAGAAGGALAWLDATPLPLLVALGVRYCAVFFVVGHATLLRGAGRHAELLRTLGRAGLPSLVRLLGPFFARPLAVAGLFVFLEALRDLSLTLLLQPFGFSTAATHLFQQAQIGQLRDAALWLLCLAAAGLYPLLAIHRLLDAPPREARG